MLEDQSRTLNFKWTCEKSTSDSSKIIPIGIKNESQSAFSFAYYKKRISSENGARVGASPSMQNYSNDCKINEGEKKNKNRSALASFASSVIKMVGGGAHANNSQRRLLVEATEAVVRNIISRLLRQEANNSHLRWNLKHRFGERSHHQRRGRVSWVMQVCDEWVMVLTCRLAIGSRWVTCCENQRWSGRSLQQR